LKRECSACNTENESQRAHISKLQEELFRIQTAQSLKTVGDKECQCTLITPQNTMESFMQNLDQMLSPGDEL
jgi:hypothetical protein